MDLFGMGFGEILLILIVALVIWGPGKLPEIARTLGKTVSTLRKASADLTAQVKRELDAEEKATSQKEKPTADSEEKKLPESSTAKDESTETGKEEQ